MPSCEGAMVSGPRRKQGVLCAHQRAADQRVIAGVERLGAGHLVDGTLLQVVLQVAADARLVEQHRHARRRQPVGRTDARTLQDRRPSRSSRPRGSPRPWRAPRTPGRLAGSARRWRGGRRTAACSTSTPVSSRRFGPLQRRLQKAARRRPAPAAPLVDVEEADASVVAGVEVGRRRDAHLRRRLGDRVEHRPSARAAPRPATRRRRHGARSRRGSGRRGGGRPAARRPSPSRSAPAGANGRSRRPGRASRSSR